MAISEVEATDTLVGYPIPLITSKLTLEPPSLFLPRQRLVDMLGEAPRPKLVLLCAPAGSGKSTLLYQLVSRPELSVVYYRLGHTDRDIPQFVSYLTAGIARHEPAFGAKVRASLSGIRQRPTLWRNVGDILTLELSQLQGRRLSIVLDDFQDVADSPDVSDLVRQLVEVLPSGVRLIVSSRGLPSLPLNRWNVQGDLLEIGPEALSFSWEETKQFFQRVVGLELQEDQIQAIHSLTEGWVAGLVFASQLVRSRSPQEAVRVLQGLADTHSPIHDYLAEQVYATQSSEMREFLRRASIFSQLSPDLCDEVIGSVNAAQKLETLHRAGLFLLSVGSGYRYRYHQLFREFLQMKLVEEDSAEVVRNLRTAAGKALEKREQWDEAILHYSLGGNTASAAALVKRFGEQAIEAGQVQRVSRWLNELSEGMVKTDPRLLMLRGLIAMRTGDTRLALRLYERCEALLKRKPDRQVEMALAFHVSVVHFREGDYAQSVHVLEKACRRDTRNLATRIELLRLLGVTYRGAGELLKADRQARKVLRLIDGYPQALTNSSVTRVATLRNLAQIKRFQGALDAAEEYCKESVQICEAEEVGEFQHMRTLTVWGAVLALRGDFGEAIQVLEMAKSRGAIFSAPERQLVSGWLANVYRDLDDLSLAESYYEQAGDSFSHEYSFLRLRQGRAREALVMAQNAMRLKGSQQSPYEGACVQVSYALGLEALGLGEMAAENLRMAAEVLHSQGYGQYYASVCLRLARVGSASGDSEWSDEWLRRWLWEGKRLHLYHFQWWDPDQFASVLARAIQADIESDYVTSLAIRRLPTERLLQLYGRDGVSVTTRTASISLPDATIRRSAEAGDLDTGSLLSSCHDPQVRDVLSREMKEGRISRDLVVRLKKEFCLTWKELLVFHYYLNAGYRASKAESSLRARVAAELFISENTLKTHVASIRRKLKLPHRIGTVGLLTWGADLGVVPCMDDVPNSGNRTAG